MLEMLAAFAVSVTVVLFLIRNSSGVEGAALDSDISGPQKFHARPVPRIGGVGLFSGIVGGALLLLWRFPDAGRLGFTLLACSLPAFGMGLVEDMTKQVSPRRRLAATALAAALAMFALDAIIRRTDLIGIDWVVGTTVGAAIVTVFVVTGVANAINIIDGFNGLASMCGAIMLASIAYVAQQAGDPALAALALAGIGAVLGFFIWNFPAGLIFLGDGGAYFLGFYIVELAILLLVRNPEVSPLFPLLVVSYPVFETLFSIYRRRFLRQESPSVPDGIHLHSLVYRRLVRWAAGKSPASVLTRRNSMTSPFLWVVCMVAVVPAMLFWRHSWVLGMFILLFMLLYVWMYWRIVRFRTPRFLRFWQ